MADRPSTYAHSDAVTWPWPDDSLESSANSVCNAHVWLRLLGTSDIHGHLLSFDYATRKPVDHFGLDRVATRIHAARKEARNTLLFDNGDYLQGSPLTDIATRPEYGWSGVNPVIEAMNHVGYDAVTLGNHEFNFGLDWLMQSLKHAKFPLVCANAIRKRHDTDPTQDQTLLPPYRLLRQECVDSNGQGHVLTVGVIGVLPPQTLLWDRDHLAGCLDVRDMATTLRAYVPKMRAAGADIVIALAHTGIGDGSHVEGQENAGLALAQMGHVDAMFLGHTHGVFPDMNAAVPANPAIRFDMGTLADVPAVMPGFRGSHLGMIDLKLVRQKGVWRVAARRARSLPVWAARAEPDYKVTSLTRVAHDATLRLASQKVGHTPVPLHSYLSQICPDPGQHLVMACKRAAIQHALSHTEYANLPVLSVSAPYKTGGAGGPDFYTNIPAGDLTLACLADLYPFPNTLVGVKVTGDHLVEWLERAASCFHQIEPGKRRQRLWNPDFAGHMFDTICGLNYCIDLSQPARYDPFGVLQNPDAHRIVSVTHQGTPLSQTADFVMALKNFRARQAGAYEESGPVQLIYQGQTLARDLLIDYIRQHGCQEAVNRPPAWRFAPLEHASVILETGPGVLAHMKDIEKVSATVLDHSTRGFLELEITL